MQLVNELKLPPVRLPSVSAVLCTFLVFAILGCSRKKDTFINRNFHAMATKYNILYNGEMALEDGREAVDDAFTDDYWHLLPIERMETTDDFLLPGETRNSDFERAEEKAIKAVQKHGMNIKGKERNPQIDEAYLLLGKARYFDQRFIPAIEAFNYILYKYPSSDKINQAKIWREKTNVRLENDELAIKNIKRLFKQEQLTDQDIADASATMAQAYLNLNAKDSAMVRLTSAARFTRKQKEKARFNFIRGQLYNDFGLKDSANMAFDKVIELHRKVPRAYYINAHLAKAANFDPKQGDPVAFEDYLKDLAGNRENRPFLGKIYYRMAEFYRTTDRDSLAVVYYNKSLRSPSQDQYLRALDYSTLGNMNFDKSEYRLAGAYYDSTLTSMEENSKPYRVIRRKRENLEDVIRYEGIVQVNDSILHLASLSPEERTTYFTQYTDRLRQQAELEKERQEAAERNNAGLPMFDAIDPSSDSGRKGGMNPPGDKSQSSFYFYNTTTVAYGKNEFRRIWGNRSLKDNWRISSSAANAAMDAPDLIAGAATDEERFDPEFYVSLIPSEPKVLDSIRRERNFANYQLGVIYQEKFNELELAKDKFKTVLASNPEERLVLPSLYNLHKTYQALGEDPAAEQIKSDIFEKYPDSRYASILRNPKSDIGKDENSPEHLYEQVFAQFEHQHYEQVINLCDQYLMQFEGEPIVPKFEMLKAVARGRLYGFEAYREGLNYLALTYPNSEEGKRAQQLLDEVLPTMASTDFLDPEEGKRFNVLYAFEDAPQEEVEAFMEKLREEVKQIRYYDLTVSMDIYDKNTIFVVVHGLKSINGARGFADLLREREANIDRPYIPISSLNYEIVQRHKNLDNYLKSL